MVRSRVGVIAVVLVVLASAGTHDQEVSDMATTSPSTSTGRSRIPAYSPPTSYATSMRDPLTGDSPNYVPEPYQDPYAAPADTGATYDVGYAAAPAPRLLAESPEWLAYLNALGMQEQSARADMDKTRGLYESDAQRQLADLPAGYISQRRGLSGSLEARGMSRSGEKIRRMAENRANQGRAESGVRAQLGFQVGSLESALANKLMDLNMARASQEMNLRSQGYV